MRPRHRYHSITDKGILSSVSNIIVCVFVFNVGFIIMQTIPVFDNAIIKIYEYLFTKIKVK